MSEFSSEEQRSEYVAALLRERARLLAAGIEDRVSQVDAELARVGHVVEGHGPAKSRRASARKAVVEAAGAAEVRN